MELWSFLSEFVRTFALPIGIAIIGSVTTVKVTRDQIRSRRIERLEDRDEKEREREDTRRAHERSVRGAVVESISGAIARYADAVVAEDDLRARDLDLQAELVKLSTRCGANHLWRKCMAYVGVGRSGDGDDWVLTSLDDIQVRLEGWHLGHLDINDVESRIEEGRADMEAHLALHSS